MGDVTKDNQSRGDFLFWNFPELHITSDVKNDVLEHSEKYASCSPRTKMGMFYTDEEKKHI